MLFFQIVHINCKTEEKVILLDLFYLFCKLCEHPVDDKTLQPLKDRERKYNKQVT